MIQYRVDQRMIRMTGGRMDHHSLGLVHDEEIIVLIQDIERDILRFCFDRRIWPYREDDPVPVPYDGGRLAVLILRTDETDIPVFDPFPDPGAGTLREEIREEEIQPFSGLLLFDLDQDLGSLLIHLISRYFFCRRKLRKEKSFSL